MTFEIKKASLALIESCLEHTFSLGINFMSSAVRLGEECPKVFGSCCRLRF